MLEEPPPFALAQDDDGQTPSGSSSAAPLPIFQKSPEPIGTTPPPFHHRVRFEDGSSNDEELNSHAPSPLPFALSSNALDDMAANDVVKEPARMENNNFVDSTALRNSSHHSDAMQMQDNNHGNDHVTNDIDGPGITILDENNDSIHRQSQSIANSNFGASSTSRMRPASSSFFQTQIIDDSIVAGAAAHVDANPNYSNVSSAIGTQDGDVSSILNQLMQYADNEEDDGDALPRIRDYENRDDHEQEIDIIDDDDIMISSIISSYSKKFFEWPKQFFTSLRKKVKKHQTTSSNNVPTAALTNPSRAPIRAHKIRHDKYIVEMDIMPPSSSPSSIFDIRDAIDILANIELLHMWFEPIPAVFDACTKDGSGSNLHSSSSPRNSPANSLNSSDESNRNHVRQYDGEWIEISSPLLLLPSDARVSSCLRATRVGFRKLIGFPARVRSMMFVERSAGRVGLTLGPYPDRLHHGTMAHHTFHFNIVADEEYGVSTGSQKIVITNEVRLQREGDEVGSNGKRNGYCNCAFFRILFALIEWITVLWYQPDLASYMAQTISSMEKLRTLIERGESAAHAGGELVMEAEDWEGGGDGGGNTSMRSPLLG